jgi:hypothetical protein
MSLLARKVFCNKQTTNFKKSAQGTLKKFVDIHVVKLHHTKSIIEVSEDTCASANNIGIHNYASNASK